MSAVKLNGVSLFSSAGIGEAFLADTGVHVVLANELLVDRADLYKKLYPNTRVIPGDIMDDKVYQNIVTQSGNQVDFLLATPPCQGMSVAGKNRDQKKMVTDERNHLIFRVIDFIEKKNPTYILIENVPNFLKILLPYDEKMLTVEEILLKRFGNTYEVRADVFDAADFGVPQRRKRAIIRMHKRGLEWRNPKKVKPLTVFDAIGHLPSLESGESSNMKWHFARNHTNKQILCMRHTPTGKSAFENKKFYPTKENGERLRGYMSTYRRIRWDEPSPTITMRNDAISSQLNVHPGRLLSDRTYSDARVLTPLELMLLTSLPADWSIPEGTPEILIRKCIGESVPPLLIKRVVEGIRT